MQLITPATRQRLSGVHPEVATELRRLESTLDDSALAPQLLQLISDFFDAEFGDRVWGPSANPTALERSTLDVCEQFMVSVADVSDAQVAALAAHMSPDELYNLMYAIYLIEMSKRLDITLERVLS